MGTPNRNKRAADNNADFQQYSAVEENSNYWLQAFTVSLPDKVKANISSRSRDFYCDLFAFMFFKGIPISPIQKMTNVDLHQLFDYVTAHGGYKALDDRMWWNIMFAMKLAGAISLEALKLGYLECLYAYEMDKFQSENEKQNKLTMNLPPHSNDNYYNELSRYNDPLRIKTEILQHSLSNLNPNISNRSAYVMKAEASSSSQSTNVRQEAPDFSRREVTVIPNYDYIPEVTTTPMNQSVKGNQAVMPAIKEHVNYTTNIANTKQTAVQSSTSMYDGMIQSSNNPQQNNSEIYRSTSINQINHVVNINNQLAMNRIRNMQYRAFLAQRNGNYESNNAQNPVLQPHGIPQYNNFSQQAYYLSMQQQMTNNMTNWQQPQSEMRVQNAHPSILQPRPSRNLYLQGANQSINNYQQHPNNQSLKTPIMVNTSLPQVQAIENHSRILITREGNESTNSSTNIHNFVGVDPDQVPSNGSAGSVSKRSHIESELTSQASKRRRQSMELQVDASEDNSQAAIMRSGGVLYRGVLIPE